VLAASLGSLVIAAQSSSIPDTWAGADVAVAPARSWLYGADSGADDGSSTLLRIDPSTGAARRVGETGVRGLTDVAMTPSGRLYAIGFTRLFELDVRTGRATQIGNGLGVSDANALAADAEGRLFVATEGGRFGTVDPGSGRVAILGSYGSRLRSSGDLAFSRNGELYGTGSGASGEVLFTVDARTGAASVRGRLPEPRVYGLAFSPAGVLLGAARGDEQRPLLISINPANGASRTVGRLTSNTSTWGMWGMTSRTVLAPVVGPLRVTGPANANCANSRAGWTFCQHRSDFHARGRGVGGSDDAYAWDVNLAANADRGRSVYPVAAGRVVPYANARGIPNPSGAVLVEHSPRGLDCSTAGSGCWWTAYLHLARIAVTVGQSVGPTTALGAIGNVSSRRVPDHLHFVLYEGSNSTRGLVSVDATFLVRR
jgi:hypothetical protein